MKKILTVLLFLPTLAFAGTWTIGAGVGTERVNDKLDVTLVEVRGSYRFDNGLILGVGQQKGYPENNGTIETRTEAVVGYSTRYDIYSPYILTAIGNRTKSSGDKNIAYTSITAGTLIKFTDNWFGDIQYRYRDSLENSWRTQKYQVGLGYNVTKNTAIMVNYGKSEGNFKSDAYSLVSIFKF